MQFRRGSSPIWSVFASLFVGPVFLVLLVPWLAASVLQLNEQARDPVELTPQEWEEFEENLSNIPYYIFRIERPRALALIRAGLETRPSRAPWGIFAVMLCAVDGERRRQLEGEERSTTYRESLQCLQRFHGSARQLLDDAPASSNLAQSVELLEEAMAEPAVEAGEIELGKFLASSLLDRNSDPNSWNYGNIVHNANQILGRVALREGKVADAKQYLLEAGRTPGSPQLNSFGPQFFLARELLEHGEGDVVLEYLDLVNRFWNGHDLAEIEQWKEEIREGKIPASVNWH